MNINEEKLKMWCEQVDRRLARLEGEENEPTEPRIEHDDSRQAIWYWASTNQVDRVRCVKDYRKGIGITRFCAEEYNSCPQIEFRLLDADVEDSEIYTIDELCGGEGKC